VRRPDGQIAWGIYSAVPFPEASDGEPTGALVTFLDITERKRDQEALQEREERLRLLLGQMPGVLWTTDLDLRVTSAAGAGLAHLDKKPDQDVGLTLYEIFQTNDPAFLPLAAHLRVLQGESISYEMEFLGRWFHSHVEPLRTMNGAILGCIGVAVDFTERKRAEEALRLAHQQHESLIHTIDGIVWEGDPRTFQFTFVSNQAEKMLGYPVEQWLNEPNFWLDKVHPDERDWAAAFCKSATAAMQPHELEYRMRAADGRYVWLRDLVNVVVENDQPSHLRGVMLDVTLRKQAEEQTQIYSQRLQCLSRRLLEVQEQERRHLARELHDEISQVLTYLKLSLEMGPRLEAHDVSKRLGEARVQIRELTTRIRDLSLRLRPTMLDDLGLIPALLWHFDRYTAQTQVRIRFEHRGLERRFAPELETAAYRIVQEALTNVARHAQTGEAKVRIWYHHHHLHVQVEDAGVGFDMERLLGSGTSNGLSGMHERADLLGGRLTIETRHGAGTRVMADLPDHPTEN
jgi:PAS domain S-box-containing protein